MMYHYTCDLKVPHILSSGRLVPTDAINRTKGTLWFSKRTDFEPTAVKALQTASGLRTMTLEEYAARHELYRFKLISDRKLESWKAVTKEARYPNKLRKQMEASGVKQGGRISDWWGTLEPIPLDELTIEKLVDGKWEPWSP